MVPSSRSSHRLIASLTGFVRRQTQTPFTTTAHPSSRLAAEYSAAAHHRDSDWGICDCRVHDYSTDRGCSADEPARAEGLGIRPADAASTRVRYRGLHWSTSDERSDPNTGHTPSETDRRGYDAAPSCSASDGPYDRPAAPRSSGAAGDQDSNTDRDAEHRHEHHDRSGGKKACVIGRSLRHHGQHTRRGTARRRREREEDAGNEP